MTATITKEQFTKAIVDLPETATLDDAIERLLFLSAVEEGLAQMRRGEGIPHEEVKRVMEEKMGSWPK